MNWLTYVWAILMSVVMCVALWLATQQIYRRLHFDDNRKTCRENNGSVIEYGSGFMCVYVSGKPIV